MNPDIEEKMIFDPAIKGALVADVARETGRPFHVVERAFNLMLEVADLDATLCVLSDGKLTAVGAPNDHRERHLPPSLVHELEDSRDDLVELLDPLYRAFRRATGILVQ